MKTLKSIVSVIIALLIGVIVAVVIKATLFQFAYVAGPSMQPNLEDHERVAMFNRAPIRHNSVIIFDAQGEDPNATSHIDYVKRVIGMPGDTVESKNGVLYVNDRKINQSYIGMTERNQGTGNWTLSSLAAQHDWRVKSSTVPKGMYFVLGDHRSVSNDSRYWGFVQQKKVAGVVKVPFWTSTASKRFNINQAYKTWTADK
ncbi:MULTISPECIES: signal peptidase I [Furfurilactobacillus]|uniref:Signal peptidase I n=1 Tax=Furfurilactobacillus rossiae TaxID=231049 RepID=A0A7C9IU86_9LACO|nr:signal peptidase I [Furfurilactobacillus milii]MYV05960.1 signal peptidase I [Furfurilactobacillus milii]